MKTRKSYQSLGITGAFMLSLTAQAALAASIPFSTSPPGMIGRPPAPNLILTLDNSGSMGTSGIQALRNALSAAFTAENVPAGSIRLGWNLFNADEKGVSCVNFSTTNCAGNAIKVFDESRRQTFLNWVNNPNNSMVTPYITPTHTAYLNALKQFDIQPTNVASPWAESPNQKIGDFLACRKSFVMLMTDGGYNNSVSNSLVQGNSRNLDSVARTLPDGTAYAPSTNPALNIYRDHPGSMDTFNSISDIAFHYWATDLVPNQGSSNNIVKPVINAPGPLQIGNTSIPEYWNPQNNPATWQHVVTHTIGFNAAATWPAMNAIQIDGFNIPSFDGNPQYPAGYNNLLTGAVTWPRLYLENASVRTSDGNNISQRKRTEMWHAAINSRGTFTPATTAAALAQAVRTIIQNVTQDTSQRIASAAGSTLSSRIDSFNYYTTYNTEKWSGDVKIQGVAASGSTTKPVATWNSAGALLNQRDVSTRKIFSSGINDANIFQKYTFTWDNLTNVQKNYLNEGNRGADRVNYLRGIRTNEGAGGFRTRESILGDIVNSKIWYMRGKPNAGYTSSNDSNGYLAFASDKSSRPDVLFVGSNDGMLHAFSASNGSEIFAYVPQGVYANLSSYTSPTYSHRYFVDGSPFTADFKDGNNWKTMLTGFMGAGAKGYFLIDVTNPNSVTEASVFADTTATSDPDIGHIFQSPVIERSNPMVTRQIARLNNNEWALITGNGYNSTNEKAVLLIHYLTGSNSGKIVKIPTGDVNGTGNGLSAPRLIDLNGDHVPDVVYAGDLHGNLWKFDIAGTDDATWGLAAAAPILRARNDANQVQPITTAPVYTAHPEGGLMIVVGTGQSLTNADRSDAKKQSFYGVRDQLFTQTGSSRGGVKITGAPSVLSRAELVQQTANIRTDDVDTIDGITYWTQTDHDVDYSTKKGWFLDMPLLGERSIDNPTWFEGSILDLYGRIPANGGDANVETCELSMGKDEYITRMVNAATGGLPKHPVFGVPLLDEDQANAYNSEGITLPRNNGEGQELGCLGDDCKDGPNRKFSAQALVGPSWRHME